MCVYLALPAKRPLEDVRESRAFKLLNCAASLLVVHSKHHFSHSWLPKLVPNFITLKFSRFSTAEMVPPQSGFKREPNAAAQLSAVQKVVRYAEKDDLLLYITAIFGIIMPALMYFFYRTVHSRFHDYNSKRKKAKKMEKQEQKKTRSITYQLAEHFDQFDPIVCNLTGADVVRKLKSASKVALLFVITIGEKGNVPESLTCFLDWLDEIRYEHRQKNFLRNVSYAAFGMLSAENSSSADSVSVEQFNKVASSLNVRMKALQGIAISDPCFVANSNELEHKINAFAEEMTLKLKQFQYGAFDNEINQPSKQIPENDSSTDNESDSTTG
uniref:Uncharacterized protein n=1 Tax=Ditylenchus dipsaci TaxID=166011 RepID=A0A915DG93_9BILA